MSWSDVTLAVVEKMDQGNIAFIALVGAICVSWVMIAFLKMILKMYTARQFRIASTNIDERQMNELVEALLGEIDRD